MGESSFCCCCCCDITNTTAPVSSSLDAVTPLTWTFTVIGDALCCSRRYKGCSSSDPGSAEVNWCACAAAPDVFPFMQADFWVRHTLARCPFLLHLRQFFSFTVVPSNLQELKRLQSYYTVHYSIIRAVTYTLT